MTTVFFSRKKVLTIVFALTLLSSALLYVFAEDIITTIDDSLPSEISSIGDSAIIPLQEAVVQPTTQDDSSQSLSSDLLVSVAGPVNASNGDVFSYTVTYTNNGVDAADGASFQSELPIGATNINVSCATATNGASCPFNTIVDDTLMYGNIDVFPNHGVVTLIITGRFPTNSPTSLSHIATIATPNNILDPNTSNNTSQINTTITTLPADLSSSISGNNNAWVYGVPVTYEVTHTNNGPNSANGSLIKLVQQIRDNSSYGATIAITGLTITCTATSGAICPSFDNSIKEVGNIYGRESYLYGNYVPSRPANSNLHITVSFIPIQPIPYSQCVNTNITVNAIPTTTATSYPMNGLSDPLPNNNQSSISKPPLPPINMPICPQADLSTTISGDTGSLVYGTPITYEITHTNNGPQSANDSLIQFSQKTTNYNVGVGITGLTITCVATSGAICPDFDNSIQVGIYSYETNLYYIPVSTRPSNSSLHITITFTPTHPIAPECSNTTISAFLMTRAVSYLVSGLSDPLLNNNEFKIAGSLLPPIIMPICPQADLSATISGSTDPWVYGTPVTYEVIHTNNGPDTVSGSIFLFQKIADGNSRYGLPITITGLSISCVGISGAICPTFSTGVFEVGSEYGSETQIYGVPVENWPSESSLHITVSFIPIGPVNCASNLDNLQSDAKGASYIRTPSNDNNYSNNESNIITNLLPQTQCVDLTALETITPLYNYTDSAMNISFHYRNSGPEDAQNAIISGYLSSGFVYQTGSCIALYGSTCGLIDYDPITKVFGSLIPYLPQDSEVIYSFSGYSNAIQGTYATYTTIQASSGEQDSNLGSNLSQLNFNTVQGRPIIHKTALTKQGVPGGQIQYKIDITNPSSGNIITSGFVTDPLPSGFNYESTSSIILSGTVTRLNPTDPISGSTNPIWGEFSLRPGDSMSIIFITRTSSSLPSGTTIYNNSTDFTYNNEVIGSDHSFYDGNARGATDDDIILITTNNPCTTGETRSRGSLINTNTFVSSGTIISGSRSINDTTICNAPITGIITPPPTTGTIITPPPTTGTSNGGYTPPPPSTGSVKSQEFHNAAPIIDTSYTCPYKDGNFEYYKKTFRDQGPYKDSIATMLNYCLIHGYSNDGVNISTNRLLKYSELYKILVRLTGKKFYTESRQHRSYGYYRTGKKHGFWENVSLPKNPENRAKTKDIVQATKNVLSKHFHKNTENIAIPQQKFMTRGEFFKRLSNIIHENIETI